MGLITVSVGYLSENTYIYFDDETKKGFVIDPGGEAERVLKAIAENNIKIEAILLTHGHYDHTGAVDKLRKASSVRVYAHEGERQVLDDYRISHTARGREVHADAYFRGGDTFTAGGVSLSVIHTPGHTAGSCCFHDAKAGILFSGDTLFYESVGRSDLPTGDGQALQDSIKNKLFTLPEETRVLPGHEEETSIGHETANNPYIR